MTADTKHWDPIMFFTTNGSTEPRIISSVYGDALSFVRSTINCDFNGSSDALLCARRTRNRLDAHDAGERDSKAPRAAALRGLGAD